MGYYAGKDNRLFALQPGVCIDFGLLSFRFARYCYGVNLIVWQSILG